MTASALWQFDQLSPEARTAADGAARHAGLPLSQWVGRLIAETAAAEGVTLGVAPRAVAPPQPRAVVQPLPIRRAHRRAVGAGIRRTAAADGADTSDLPPPVIPKSCRQLQRVVPGGACRTDDPRQPRPEAPQATPAPIHIVPRAPAPMPSPAAPPVGAVSFGGMMPPALSLRNPAPDRTAAGEFLRARASSLECARGSKRRAAVFATEVADWRVHEERPARAGTPWPVFGEYLESEPYVPFETGADSTRVSR